MNDEVMTKKEAAAFLKLSVGTIDRLMRERKIPFSKINGKVLFQKKDLLEVLEKRKVK